MSMDKISDKDKQLLDRVLEGKPDDFKVKVYDVVRLFGLDANDPAFLLLISTGQLQVLLEQFPEVFEGLFSNLRGKQEQSFTEFVKKLKGQVETLTGSVSTASSALETQVKELKEYGENRKQETDEQVAAILALAEHKEAEVRKLTAKEREAAKATEERLREERIEAHQRAIGESAEQLIAAAAYNSTVRFIRYWLGGALFFLVLGGVVGGVVVWSTATTEGEKNVRSEAAYSWAMEDYSINQRFYKECQKQKKKTCNVNTMQTPVP